MSINYSFLYADLLTQNANIEDVWGTGRSVMEQHSKTALQAQTAPNVIGAGEIWGTGLSITKQQPATPLPTQTIPSVTSKGNIWGTGQLSATHQPPQTASNVMKAVSTWGTGQSVTAKASGKSLVFMQDRHQEPLATCSHRINLSKQLC